MRCLPKRLDHVHRAFAFDRTEANRFSDSIGIEWTEVPLRVASRNFAGCCPRREGDGAIVMDTKNGSPNLSRRRFLKETGVLVVAFSTAGMLPVEVMARAAQGNPVRDYPKFPLDGVDSFVEIHGDGKVLIKIGKINNGQGTPTSWAMMAADELDILLNKVEVRFGDTAAT